MTRIGFYTYLCFNKGAIKQPTFKTLNIMKTINIQPNMKETLSNIEHLYLDYVNNFLLVSTFADYYGIDEATANKIIDLGRFINRNK